MDETVTEPEDYEMTEQDWDDMEEVERRKRLGALHTIQGEVFWLISLK